MAGDRYDILDLGLRAPLEGLRERAAALRPGGAGATVFVAGQEGSGRTALLDSFVADVAGGHSAPLVLSGSFESGEYAPRNGLGDRLKKAGSLAESALTVAGPLHPMVAIAAQLAAGSKAARKALATLVAKSKREHPIVLVPELLRRAAQAEGPVVCAIDDADRSSQAWWSDLMLSLARQVAVDLPLLLVFAVEGPGELGDHAPDEPPGLFVARQLVGDGLAEWQPLRGQASAEVAAWIGPADPAIPRQITEIAGGRASWTADIWDEWRRDGVVREDDDGWSLAAEASAGLGPVSHLLGRRLQRALGEESLPQLAVAQQLLACAALEGRVFTADALALVLEQEPDEVIDFLDDHLSGGAEGTLGLVEELPTLSVTDEGGVRHLRRYRFRAELDWLVSRHYGFPGQQQREQRALSLAGALMSLYGAAAGQVALAAAELFELGGQPENARNVRRIHNVTTDRETMLFRARQALGTPGDAAAAERNRAAEILVAGAVALYNSGPWPDGLRFCEAAIQLADVRSVESRAYYYGAWFRFHVEDVSGARKYLERALADAEAEADRSGIADALHQIANVDLTERRFPEAEDGYRKVLRIREAEADHEARSRVHEALGDLSHRKEDYPAARARYEIAAGIAEEIGDRRSWANTRFRIARIEFEDGEVDACRKALGEVIPILREFGIRQTEIGALSLLSDAEYASDRFEQAHGAAARALEISREIGNPDEASLFHRLATVEWTLDRPQEARSAYRAAIASAEREGEHESVLMSSRALVSLEFESENWGEARRILDRALKIAVAVGARFEEVEAHRLLAKLLYLEDRTEEARRAFLQVLPMQQGLGDEEGEGTVHRHLGAIAYDGDDFEAADHHLTRALEILARVGDAEGEAIAGMYMGALELGRGEVDQGRQRLRRTLELQRQLGDTEGEASTLQLLAEVDP